MNEINAALIAACAALSGEETAASALSELTAFAGKQAERTAIDMLLGDRAQVRALLFAGSPKTRKNAARLLGALLHDEDVDALSDALSGEDTLFVVPSILLALGSIGGEDARTAIRAYTVPVPADETQEKHCREIALARDKALDKLSSGESLPVYTLSAPRKVLLVAPEGFSKLLCDELSALGYVTEPAPRGAFVTTDNLQKLFRARCMQQLLLPIAENIAPDADEIASLAAKELTLPWRMELTGYEGDRRAFIASLVTRLPRGNAPSHYAVELLVSCHGDSCDLFLHPTTIPDGRFLYRKKALSASVAPATAACLSRLAADAWLSTHPGETPNVYDPFCGSATLLIELDKILHAHSLLGTDIKPYALDAARINCAAAHVRAQFIQKDCTRFIPRAPFDIILSNMPFGNRVGTHEHNEGCYRDFIRHLPSLMTPTGVAVLYTTDFHLLERCIGRTHELQLLTSVRTEAGGLLPWVFVLQKRA